MTKGRNLPSYIHRRKRDGVLIFAKRIGGRVVQVRLQTQFPEGDPVPFALHQERERLLSMQAEVPPERLVPLETKLRGAVKSARNRAKKQGVPFSLPDDWAIAAFKRQGGKCAASGLDMDSHKKHDPWQPSIDRIVPAKGYTPKNCRLVAYIYNCARNQFSDDDLLKLCRALTP